MQGLKTKNNNRTSSLYDFFDILNKTHTIITARYHGLILSRVFNINNIESYGYCNYKYEAESKFSSEKSNNLELIKSYIEDNKVFDYLNWNEDDRNTKISEIHNETGIDISLIQNWTNRKLNSFKFKN